MRARISRTSRPRQPAPSARCPAAAASAKRRSPSENATTALPIEFVAEADQHRHRRQRYLRLADRRERRRGDGGSVPPSPANTGREQQSAIAEPVRERVEIASASRRPVRTAVHLRRERPEPVAAPCVVSRTLRRVNRPACDSCRPTGSAMAGAVERRHAHEARRRWPAARL